VWLPVAAGGLNQSIIPETFYHFVRTINLAPACKAVVGFDLQLIGFDLVRERPVTPRVHLVLYWRSLQPIEADVQLFSVLTDPVGGL
jgi:hypothetical protein